MTDSFIWAVIIGMALANFAVRFIPIAVVSRLHLPRPVMRWLSFVPVAVMGALVSTEVLRPGGEFIPPLTNPYLLAALPTGLVYWRTRSFLGATLVGMVLFVLIQNLLG